MGCMKECFRRVLRKPLTLLLSLFFEKKYLDGRFFNSQYTGFLWAIRAIWQRNILRLSPPMPFPVGLTCVISDPENLIFHPDDLNNFQTGGTYYQNFAARIYIGRGTLIAPNVGLITANHDPMHPNLHQKGSDISLGEECWIGMNSIVLPGVKLGSKTIVAAGSVVTRSFPEGLCIVAGTPARKIRDLRATREDLL